MYKQSFVYIRIETWKIQILTIQDRIQAWNFVARLSKLIKKLTT